VLAQGLRSRISDVCKATITSPQRRQLVLLSDNYFSPVTAQLL
jgi:hypothetical protein